MTDFYEYDYSDAMDALAEMEEWDRMDQWNRDQMDIWNEEPSLNEVQETTGEESTQEEQYAGVEDDDDNDSVTTVVIHPSDTKTTGQGAYVYCRPRTSYNNVIGYDSD
jgi:hypothetical protein